MQFRLETHHAGSTSFTWVPAAVTGVADKPPEQSEGIVDSVFSYTAELLYRMVLVVQVPQSSGFTTRARISNRRWNSEGRNLLNW